MSAKHRRLRTDHRTRAFYLRIKPAKTIVFFSGKKINRFAILHERTILKEKGLRLIKVNNVVLRKILKNSVLKSFQNNLGSYNLIATTTNVLTEQELVSVSNLTYNNVVMTGAVSNKIIYNKPRLDQVQFKESHLKIIPTLLGTQTFILLSSVVQTFIINKILLLPFYKKLFNSNKTIFY